MSLNPPATLTSSLFSSIHLCMHNEGSPVAQAPDVSGTRQQDSLDTNQAWRPTTPVPPPTILTQCAVDLDVSTTSESTPNESASSSEVSEAVQGVAAVSVTATRIPEDDPVFHRQISGLPKSLHPLVYERRRAKAEQRQRLQTPANSQEPAAELPGCYAPSALALHAHTATDHSCDASAGARAPDIADSGPERPLCGLGLSGSLPVAAPSRFLACDSCAATFGSRSSLERHRCTHTGAKAYTCIRCGKAFAYSSDLLRHAQRLMPCTPAAHSARDSESIRSVKRYACAVCDKTFARADSLRRHHRLHTGERPYQCHRCGQTFTDSSGLHKHGQRVVPCAPSGLAPARSQPTSGIIAIHPATTPSAAIAKRGRYIIDTSCSSASDTDSSSDRSVDTFALHDSDVDSICGNDSDSTDLVVLTDAGSPRRTCDLCAKTFPANKAGIHSLRLHRQTHFEEDTQDTADVWHRAQPLFNPQLTSQWQLSDAVTNPTAGPASNSNDCRVRGCVQQFARPSHLERHMEQHTRGLPFACCVCGCSYSGEQYLTAHMILHHSTA